MNKFVKILIIINGLIIPTLLLVGLIVFFEPFKKTQKEGITISTPNESKLEEDNERKINRNLLYFEPNEIYNSSNYYLPIMLETEEVDDDFKLMKKGSNSKTEKINVIFLNENFEVLKVLLDKNAFIQEIKTKSENDFFEDKRYCKNFIYSIAFNDTNEDGVLSKEDEFDLFISDLAGGKFKQITKDKNIISFDFFNQYSQIIIKYKEENSTLEKFEIYDIEKDEFKPVSSLNNSLELIQQKIIN